MFHYLFTNDLRISSLAKTMKDVAVMHIQETVPSAKEAKGVNNNAMTLGFYFNLMNRSYCSYAAANGNVRRVVLNFVKKFQFPNPRTIKSLQYEKADNIQLAPMRVILKLLYIIYITDGEDGYLTKDEIKEFVFYNTNVAKVRVPNLIEVYKDIKEFRCFGTIPASIAPEVEREWHQDDRQIREMIKVLLWSGCVVEGEIGKYYIKHSALSVADKADLFEIITENSFWDGTDREDYFKYMDMLSPEEEMLMEQQHEKNQKMITRNRIIFGAPGTGKSYLLNRQIGKIVPKDDDGNIVEEYFERVTFYPSYTYSQFVGAYKPKPKKVKEKDASGNEIEKEIISYEFVPGPFTRILLQALKLKQHGCTENCMLVIEEINRANAAAVFGDIFQLLDRKIDGNSEYSIETNYELRAYLAKELEKTEKECAKIVIPSNLFIWATMNNADQGVTPMDTAFKRRWDFEYIGIDDGEYALPYLNDPVEICGLVTSWNKIRKEINRLLQTSSIRLSEDKLIGPFFLAGNAFCKIETEEESNESIATLDSMIFKTAFKSKVLMYLFEDAVKSKKSQIFDAVTYSQLCEDFELVGLKIFKGIDEENLVITNLSEDKGVEEEETSMSENGQDPKEITME